MARLRLVTATDPARLLRHAAAGFLVPARGSAERPFPTVDYLLVVRQGGVRDDVLALAADAGVRGWFDPPLSTFSEFPRRLGIAVPAPLGDQERRVVVGEVLRAAAPRVFGRLGRSDRFVDAVDTLFGELLGEGVEAGQFDEALRTRLDSDDFERARDADLASAYARYHEELGRLAKGDPRALLQQCAAGIAAEPAGVARSLGGRRSIRLFGLADLRGGWRTLLGALADCPALDEIVVYSSSRLTVGALSVEHEALDEPASAATRLFTDDSGGGGASSTSFVAAPDVERELDDVARRIRRLIVEDGASPHRIAIVTRQTRPHVDLACASLDRFGIPYIARRRIGLGEIPSVRAVRRLFAAAASGWNRAGLSGLADDPYLECELDTRLLDLIGYRRRVSGLAGWERAFRELEQEARVRESRATPGDESRGRALPPAAEIGAARERFVAFSARAKALDVERPLAGWLDWLQAFIDEDQWGVARRLRLVPHDRLDVVRRDLAGWGALGTTVREWREAVRTVGVVGDALTVEAFDIRLRDALDGDVPLWTPRQRGVQVLEALAAAYRSFDHVFLVGMEAGQFPAPAARSPVLDDADRDALIAAGLRLDAASVRDERERELFRVLVAGAARSLTVSYARMDANGGEVIRSSFVDELAEGLDLAEEVIAASVVIVPGVPLYGDAPAREQATIGATIERERALALPSPYDGVIADPALVRQLGEEFGDAKTWSATQLEEFAKCPWSYFSKRLLGMERLEDPSEDMEPSVLGVILHDALKRFFDAAHARVGGPVFILPVDLAGWGDDLIATSVDDAFAALAGTWLGNPGLERAKRGEVLRIARGYLAFEASLHDDMTDPGTKKRNAPKMIRTGVVQHELVFDDMVYEHDGVRIRYRGSIDRVEVSDSIDDRLEGVAFVAAADYKTSKGSTPGGGVPRAWDDGVVLQVPLYAWALAQLYPGHEVARVEYLALRKPETVHQLQPYTFDKRAGTPVGNEDAEEQWKRSLQQAAEHVRRARTGVFPAAPPASCGCPPWCQGIDVCRVKTAGER